MDSAQWTQEFGVTKSMPEIAAAISMGACTTTRPTLMEKKIMRPPKDLALNCPRCQSTNTKFCYYNNYSLTQPRYFCKTCRRYWTEGGTLRNVPVGGGSRKHKKSISSAHNNSNNSPNSLSMAMDQLPILSPRLALPDLNPPSIAHFSSRNPKIHDQGQDLNLGFQAHDHPQEYHHQHHGLSQFLEFPKIEGKDVISSSSSSSSPLLALNFLRNGNIGAGGLNSFIPNMVPNSDLDQSNGLFSSSAGFPFQECKPSLAFSIDGNINSGSGYPNPNAPEENIDGTLMFTLGATKRHSSTSDQGDDIQDKGSNENCNGFWNGMLGGGSW